MDASVEQTISQLDAAGTLIQWAIFIAFACWIGIAWTLYQAYTYQRGAEQSRRVVKTLALMGVAIQLISMWRMYAAIQGAPDDLAVYLRVHMAVFGLAFALIAFIVHVGMSLLAVAMTTRVHGFVDWCRRASLHSLEQAERFFRSSGR